MTIYYIDPTSGSDTNTGLSWAQAWKTMRGLRVASIVPGAGDEIRFAKSPAYSPSMGAFERVSGYVYPLWYFRGELIFDPFSDPYGAGGFQPGQQPTGLAVVARRALSHYNGVVTVDVPEDAYNYSNHYAQTHATAYAGEYNATGTMLFGVNVGSLQFVDSEGLRRVTGAIRCHVPYSGPGTQDLPAGAITVSVYLGTTLLASQPLPAVRNSSTIWTPFEINFTPLAAQYAPTVRIEFTRTGAALDRDNSPFGIESMEYGFEVDGGMGSTHTVLQYMRGPITGGLGSTIEVAGNTAMPVFCEVLNPIDAHDNGDATTLWPNSSYRIPTTGNHLLCHKVTDVHLTGAQTLSPAGALGVYDLNGSTGGTAGSPLKLTGGWNTSSEVLDGYTVFSAGITHKIAFPFALFDLGLADNVRIENLGGAYGFASLITRAKTVYLKACMLPWSLKGAFGAVTTNTNVTLEDMYINPLVMEGFGIIGDLTLKNTIGAGFSNSKADRRREVNNLSMYDSHIRDWYLIYVRGNAVLEQCMLISPPILISTEFGHTLTFKNHKPASPSATAYLIQTSPQSRWDVMDYQDASYPTYNFSTAQTIGSSCDAKLIFNGSPVSWIGGSYFPSTLRGSYATETYTDSFNDFSSNGSTGSSEGSERGYTYAHMMGRRPEHNSLENPFDMGAMGEILAPPWAYHSDGVSRVVTQSPDASAAGRVFLVKRFQNIAYRSPDQLFVMTGRTPQYTGGTVWSVLKAVYVPRAGSYRAHFGLMKENLSFNFSQGGAYSGSIAVPLTMTVPYDPVSTGEFLGRVGVYSNVLTGASPSTDVYATDAAGAAAGSGNKYLDEWHDYYVDFSTTAGGLVELRLSTGLSGVYMKAIFDILNIYELP